ncbi:hypothetical protein KEM56_005191, partial [Ascosphaera pollenicola]
MASSLQQVPGGGNERPVTSEMRSEKRRSSIADRLAMERKPVKKPARLSTAASKGNASRPARASHSGPNSPMTKGKEKEKENRPESRWEPQASLVPHTSAPLSSRVSVPPVSSTIPQRLRPVPFKDVDLDGQEKAIIEDLLFVFMGHEGRYIHFTNNYNPSTETDRLIGPS